MFCGTRTIIPDRHTRNSLKHSIEFARSSVEDITNTINKLYDRSETVYYKKTNVLKKEKDLIESLDKAEKKKYILKKKLYCVLSPLENEEKLVDDLIKLNNLKSLPELVNLNSPKKKKDILRLFKLRKFGSEEDNIGDSVIQEPISPVKSSFRMNLLDKSPSIRSTIVLSPIVQRGSKFLDKIKTRNHSPIKLISATVSPLKSHRSSSKKVTPLPSSCSKRKSFDVDIRKGRGISSIF
jgi:hypothetical protein